MAIGATSLVTFKVSWREASESYMALVEGLGFDVLRRPSVKRLCFLELSSGRFEAVVHGANVKELETKIDRVLALSANDSVISPLKLLDSKSGNVLIEAGPDLGWMIVRTTKSTASQDVRTIIETGADHGVCINMVKLRDAD